MFSRILIANRGEIALRVIRACRELDVESVVVYSEADRGAAYLSQADRAVCIGPAAAAESYLNIARIIAAAEVADVQAIHPGYGFLAENAHFAEVCRSCKIEFIGPSVEAMRLLGNKVEARKLAAKADVPTVPGSDGPIAQDEEAVELARTIGFPVIVKAAAGGGGRGMRIAHNDISLRNALHAARSEAEAAFRDSTIYIERFIENARHVEVQVLADLHGNIVHLWERDCTIQRRYQKLLEETPSPAISPQTRQALCEAAVCLARAAGYTNAGTFEFLLDPEGRFHFSEANTRIQVEHPVTEMVTDVDLVQWQLRIASGEALPWEQEAIRQQGVAIECRINAEDPEAGFRPSPGRIERLVPPGGPGVRFDSHVYVGYEVSPSYDSLVGKLIVHRPSRPEAVRTLGRALGEFQIAPLKTTVPFFLELLDTPEFHSARYDTEFVSRHWSR